MADGLGVELAAEVFQATIDLDGDHPLAGAEPACDADGSLINRYIDGIVGALAA